MSTAKQTKNKEKLSKSQKQNLFKLKNIFYIVQTSIIFLSISFALFPVGSSLRVDVAYPSILIAVVFYISFITMIFSAFALRKTALKIDNLGCTAIMRTKPGRIYNILFVFIILLDIVFSIVDVNQYIIFAVFGLTLFTFLAGILYNGRAYTILNPDSSVKKNEEKDNQSESDNSENSYEKESVINE